MRLSRVTSVMAAMLAVWLMLPAIGLAQVPLPPLIPTESPEPEPDPDPTPTPTKETTAAPAPAPTKTKSPATSEARPKRSAPRPKPVDPAVAEGLSVWAARADARTPARTTTRLLGLLERANGGREPSFDAAARGFGRFPVVGYVWYQDDWLAPRPLPYFHLHEGTDLFAVEGTPVIASVDGFVWKTAGGGSGGTAAWLIGDDGVRYYYGHLQRLAKGVTEGLRVRTGDRLGYVGNTGTTATGTYPHVHFEINPGGRGTINPKPVLDAWLFDAEAGVLRAIGAAAERRAFARFGAGGWDVLMDLAAEPSPLPPAFWTAGASASALAFADLALAELLAAPPWTESLAGGASGAAPPIDPLSALEEDAAAGRPASGVLEGASHPEP